MGQMLKTHNAQQNEDVKSIISKLKSARILTAYRHGEDYYQTAEQLLEKTATVSVGISIITMGTITDASISENEKEKSWNW